MKRILSILSTIFLSANAVGQNFTVDGLTYTVTSEENKTVQLISGAGAIGDVIIPTSVTVPASGEVSAQWSVQSGPEWTVSTVDGNTIYKSGKIGDNESTVIRCTFRAKGTVAFKCKNQGESGCDYLTIGSIDEVCTRNQYSSSLAGKNGEWVIHVFTPTDENEHYVEFCYSKDGSVTNDPDCAEIYICDYQGMTYSVTSVFDGALFSGNHKLTSVSFQVSFSSVLENIPSNMFYDCTSLTHIDLSKTKTVGESAFGRCFALEEVNLPIATTISSNAFIGCQSLKTVLMPKVKTIGNNVFGQSYDYTYDDEGYTIDSKSYSCDKLENLDLSSVEFISNNAFCSCWNIKSLRIGSVSQWCNVSYESGRYNSGMNPLAVTTQPVTLYIGNSTNPATSISDNNITNLPNYIFKNCADITKISFPNATTVGERSFYGCNSLTNASLPKAVTIGNEAFYSCEALSEISLPKVTEVKREAFSGCHSLASIALPEAETIGDYAFYACSSLKTVSLPKAKSIGGYSLGGYWRDYYDDKGNWLSQTLFTNKIETLDLPEVRTIGNSAFYNCSNLEYISIPKVETIGSSAFNGANVNKVRVSSADQWCNIIYPESNDEWTRQNTYPFGNNDYNRINYLYIGDSDTPATELTLSENVTKIPYYAFKNTQIHIIHFAGTTPPVVDDLCAFNDWTMLAVPESAYQTYKKTEKYAEIPLQITIDGHLTENLVNVKAADATSVIQKTIGEKYLGSVVNLTVSGTINSYDMMVIRNKMTSLRNLDLTNAKIVDCDYEYYTGYHSEEDVVGPYWFTTTKLMNVKLPKTANVIGNNLFYNCSSLMNVEIPNGITKIGDYAFAGCYRADGFRIPEGVTGVGESAFSGCKKFQNIVIPSTLTYIPYDAFRIGNEIENVTIPSTLNQISYNAFSEIKNLHISDLRSWMNVDTGDGLSVDNLYIGNSKTPTEEIIVPEDIKKIKPSTFQGFSGVKKVILPKNLETIGSAAFSRSGITEIKLPEKISKLEDYTFYNCNSLETIEFNDSLKTIGYEAFGNCNSIKEINLSPFTEVIAREAFSGCTNLEEILIPSGIQQIYNNAFDNCPKLNKVIATTVEPIHIIEETFGAVYKTAEVYAPKTSFENYYWNTEWSQFLNVKEYDSYYGDSYKYKYFYLKHDFHLDKKHGRIHGCPKADFHDHCGLIVDGDEMQELDSICLKHTGHDGASIIGHGNIHAKKVVVEIDIQANKWYFFYFPVEIDLKEVKYHGSHVWYYYDGEARAENGNGGWTKVTGGKLEVGRGYIF